MIPPASLPGLLSHGALAVVVLEARQVGQVDENHGAGEEPLPVTDPEHPFSVAQVQRGRRFVLAKDLEQDLDHCMSHGFTQDETHEQSHMYADMVFSHLHAN